MVSCLPVMWVNGPVYSNDMFDPRILNVAFNLIPILNFPELLNIIKTFLFEYI